ncbi:DUF4190 domain-containing protein [Streptomyces sp. NPDC047928]|uniref:DUF4190 domain-containing protein n=1 Tax=unclassified Streptomyces TaxID=2593676 RepID=UPI00371DDEBE
MSEKSEPNDPWAPPESRPPVGDAPHGRPPVHDQPTMASMPGAGFGPVGGDVPPPPVAPGGPAQPEPGPYGYPAATGAAPTVGGYGYAGYPGYSPYGQGGWQQAPANGMGITSMVLGIISVVGFCLYGLGMILGVLALIFGIIGRKRVQRGEANNAGMATAGIVTGVIGTVLSAAFLGFIIWAIATGEEFASERDRDSYSTTLVVDTAH